MSVQFEFIQALLLGILILLAGLLGGIVKIVRIRHHLRHGVNRVILPSLAAVNEIGPSSHFVVNAVAQ